MLHFRRIPTLVATLIGLTLLGQSSRTLASDSDAKRTQTATALSATCSVKQILASQEPGGIDPKLAALKGQLSKPPFSSFKSFKLLAESAVALENREPGKIHLETAQDLALTYMEKLAQQGTLARMRMRMQLTQAGKSILDTLYAIDEGAPLLQAGQPFRGGTFVLAISCKPR